MQYSISFRLRSYYSYIAQKLNVKLFIRIIAAYQLYKKANAGQYKSDEADNIIWLYYPNFQQLKKSITWDILLITYVALCKQKYKIHRGPDIGKYRNKNILFTIHKDKINLFEVENYSASYQLVTQQLEEQKNNVYPSYDEILYWENKIYMHNMFDKLGIKSPKTNIYSNFEDLIENETTFPFLIKVPHSSGSYGQFNVVDRDYLLTLRTDSIILENNHYLAQERLNITMDMRIILVAGEIVHSYWRKNTDKSKWKTTSTSHGSVVDFENFPEQWRQNIINSFNKLNLIMGAFDLGWQNDDLSTEPYIFEVSPSYDINPKMSDPEILSNYGAWKKKILLKGSFDRLFVEDTYDIKKKGVEEFFKRINAKKEQEAKK